MKRHPLIQTLFHLKGNPRACVFTEPLWGIPFGLYSPFISVYMLSFGMSDSQIGLITSIQLFLEVFWMGMSGILSDKLGRKRTTFIADMTSWSIPLLIWATAQNFYYFLIAAIFASVWRVSANSWNLLLIEDAEEEHLVDIFSWVHIAGQVAPLLAPITSPLLERYQTVPTMRVLYVIAFVMMTTKFVLLNFMVTETEVGKVRMEETKDQNLFKVFLESPKVIKRILKSRAMLIVGALMLILQITMTIRGTFWGIIVTQHLGFRDSNLAWFFFAQSVAMLVSYFVIMPRVRDSKSHWPLLIGLVGMAVSQLVLILTPANNAFMLYIVSVLVGLSLPFSGTFLQKLTTITVDKAERARIMGMMSMVIIALTAPFGWIAGVLSEINRVLPFFITITLYTIGALIIIFILPTLERKPA